MGEHGSFCPQAYVSGQAAPINARYSAHYLALLSYYQGNLCLRDLTFVLLANGTNALFSFSFSNVDLSGDRLLDSSSLVMRKSDCFRLVIGDWHALRDQLVFSRYGRCLRAVSGPQLGDAGAHVITRRVGTNHQLLGNLGIAQAFNNKCQHLKFAVA